MRSTSSRRCDTKITEPISLSFDFALEDFGLIPFEHRGRLIEDHERRAVLVLARVRARRFARDLDGAADFDHLPMSKGEVTHLCSRVNLGADSLEDRRRVC